MIRALRWLDGWRGYWRAVYMSRAKKHGAGAQPWPIALYLGGCTRFIIYGQHYPNSRSFRQQRSRDTSCRPY